MMMEDEGCKRKRTGTIVSRCNHDPQGEKKHISATPHDETETIAANLNFKVGDEVFFKGKIKDSEGFSGEILSVNAIDDNGRYRLGMANPCWGLWGDHIWRSASTMKRHARRINMIGLQNNEEGDATAPDFIPITFSLENAVFDNRTTTSGIALSRTQYADFMNGVLDGWHLADSWMDDAWTVPVHLLNQVWKSHRLNYSILYLVLKDFVENKFKPHADESFDAFFILPPVGGSAQVLAEYAKACENKNDKFEITFNYVWILVDKKRQPQEK